MRKVTPWNLSFVGLVYFLSRPRLWLGPLFGSFFIFLILLFSFIFVSYYAWPSSPIFWDYVGGIFKAFAFASLTIVLLWVLFFSTFLAILFERLLRKVLKEKGEHIHSIGLLNAAYSSLIIFLKTWKWRLFWPLLTFAFLFIFSPLALVFSQIAIGHIAIIDALDLSLALQGIPTKRRLVIIRKRGGALLASGIIAGILSVILSISILAWLFFLPGIYIGTLLWTLSWSNTE